MTKYILIGGYPYKAKDGGLKLCQEAIKGLSQPVNILICLFARPRETWDKQYEKYKELFIKNLLGVSLNFELAEINSFIEQIERNNVLFFSGGDTGELLSRLEKIPKWLKKLGGKIVLGSSAGADILSKYNYDLELFKCSGGFGLAPVKTLVHYGTEKYQPPIGWEKALEQLKNYKEDLPVWVLREGEFKSIEVSNSN